MNDGLKLVFMINGLILVVDFKILMIVCLIFAPGTNDDENYPEDFLLALYDRVSKVAPLVHRSHTVLWLLP